MATHAPAPKCLQTRKIIINIGSVRVINSVSSTSSKSHDHFHILPCSG